MLKRGFDFAGALLGLILVGWLIVLAALAARMDVGASGIFRHRRVGRDGRPFDLLKIRTMRSLPGVQTNVTTADDPRITRLGRVLRRTKIDELPQLVNVLKGEMSFVGPRPDVAEYTDHLSETDRVVLSVRPGITGLATLRFRDEEQLLARQADPERYNREVIFPEKIRLNRQYIEEYSFLLDLKYLILTLTGGQPGSDLR